MCFLFLLSTQLDYFPFSLAVRYSHMRHRKKGAHSWRTAIHWPGWLASNCYRKETRKKYAQRLMVKSDGSGLYSFYLYFPFSTMKIFSSDVKFFFFFSWHRSVRTQKMSKYLQPTLLCHGSLLARGPADYCSGEGLIWIPQPNLDLGPW